MNKFAVIGSPISHSLSPVIHTLALKYYDIEGTYDSIDVTPQTLKETLDQLSQEQYEGINITSPLKELVPLYVSDLQSDLICKWVTNTLYRHNGLWHTANTDVNGVLDSIERFELPDPCNILILGGGGTAKTVAYTLTTRYKKMEISICARTPMRVKQFVESIENISVHPWEDRSTLAQSSHFVINATTLGIHWDTPLPLDIEYPLITAYLDALYYPKETPLLKKFRSEDKQVLNGIDWFIAQADASFHYWTGKHFPEEVKQPFREYYAKMANSR